MIVVDASVWVDKLRGVLPSDLSDVIRTEGCVAPAHVDFEVGAALIRLERRDQLPKDGARQLIEAFGTHPVERVLQPRDTVAAVEIVDNATYADAW